MRVGHVPVLLLGLCFLALVPVAGQAEPIPPICDVTCEPDPSDPGYENIQLARPLRRNNRGNPPFEPALPGGNVAAGNKKKHVFGSESYNYALPILSLPGRNGLDLNLVLHYNSRLWTMVTLNSEIVFNADCDHPGYGFRLDFGYIEKSGTSTWILSEPDGTKRQLHATNNNKIWRTQDSSYIEWNSGAANLTLKRKDGAQWKYQVITGTLKYRPKEIKDTNGNFITITYKTFGHLNIDTITDTLSRIIRFDYNPIDDPPEPFDKTLEKVVRVNAAGDILETYATFTWSTTQPFTYSFAPALTPNAPTSPLKVNTKVTFANNTAVEFEYGLNGDGAWGIVHKIKQLRPDGSVRSYVRYDFPTAQTQLSDAPTYTKQFVSPDGASEVFWQFGTTKASDGHVLNTTITDPPIPPATAGGRTVVTFNSGAGWRRGLPTKTEIKKPDPDNTVLRSVDPSWTDDNDTGKNPRVDFVTTALEPTGANLQSKVDFTYAGSGNVSIVQEFASGAGAPGSLVRRTDFAYLTTTPYTDLHILDRVTQVLVKDSDGATVRSRTDFAYDSTSLTSVTGAANHDDAAYGPSFTTRGNLTSITRCLNVTTCTGSNAKTTTLAYDTLGNVRTTTDPGPHDTNFGYTDNFSDGINRNTFAYLTQITNALNHVTTLKYYFETGLLERVTDPNNQTTTFTYDSMNRPLVTALPDGGQRSLAYDDATPAITETTKIDASQNLERKTIFDGLYRAIQTQVLSDPEGIVKADFTYDNKGRLASQSNPYRTTAESTYGVTQFQYDDLDRITKVIPPDGSDTTNHVLYTYSGNCTTVTDQAGKKRKTCADALGRTVEAWEPDSGGTFIYRTRHQYDPMDNLLCVHQKGNDPTADKTCDDPTVPATWRPRKFTYNSLSQLTQENTPEGGVVTYNTYDNDGNLTQKTDPRTIVTTFAYDALHRLLTKDYSDTPANPDASYFYDQTSYNGLTITNGKGRSTGMSDASGQTAFSYDSGGRVLAERRTNNSVTAQTGYLYNFIGGVTKLTYPLSSREITYSYSAAARPLSAVDVANGVNYVTQATYCACGAPASLKNGLSPNELTRTWTYNNRLQPTSIVATSPSATLLNLTYSYDLDSGAPVVNNGSVSSVVNNRDTNRNQAYTYDHLNRLASVEAPATAPNPWKQTFAYDVWANLLSIAAASGTPPRTLNVAVNPNNRISDTGFTYDAAGNMTADGGGTGTHTYQWDSENWLQSVDSGLTTYTYDAIHWRAKKQTGADGKLYWYNANTGEVLAETTLTGSVQREYIYFGGIAMARRDTNPGSPYYRFTDHLASLRVLTDSTGTIKQELDYDPFGAEIAITSSPGIDDQYRFISKERDAESLNDHYWFRQYSPRLGRWCSADPLGGSIALPQSLNRYSYVSNDPLNHIDPLGLDDLCGPGCHAVPTGADQWYCDCWANGGGGPPNPGQCYNVYIDGVYSGNTCTNIAPFLDGAGTPDVPSNPKPTPPKPGDPICSDQYCEERYKNTFWDCMGAGLKLTALGTLVGAAVHPVAGVLVAVAGPLYSWTVCEVAASLEYSNCKDEQRALGCLQRAY